MARKPPKRLNIDRLICELCGVEMDMDILKYINNKYGEHDIHNYHIDDKKKPMPAIINLEGILEKNRSQILQYIAAVAIHTSDKLTKTQLKDLKRLGIMHSFGELSSDLTLDLITPENYSELMRWANVSLKKDVPFSLLYISEYKDRPIHLLNLVLSQLSGLGKAITREYQLKITEANNKNLHMLSGDFTINIDNSEITGIKLETEIQLTNDDISVFNEYMYISHYNINDKSTKKIDKRLNFYGINLSELIISLQTELIEKV